MHHTRRRMQTGLNEEDAASVDPRPRSAGDGGKSGRVTSGTSRRGGGGSQAAKLGAMIQSLDQKIVVWGGGFVSARLTPEATAHALALALPEEVVIPWCWRCGAAWTDTSRYAWVDGRRRAYLWLALDLRFIRRTQGGICLGQPTHSGLLNEIVRHPDASGLSRRVRGCGELGTRGGSLDRSDCDDVSLGVLEPGGLLPVW